MPDPARILVVCTANVCRSPLGEALLDDMARRHLGDDAVQVSSAGVLARPGASAAQESQRIARRWGSDLAAHRSRRIDRDLVVASDLIITMADGHRDAVLRLQPAAMTRTFTWLEMARLSDQVGPPVEGEDLGSRTRITRATRALHRSRPWAPDPGDGADDVFDPMGGSRHQYQEMATTLVTAAQRFLPLLLLGSPR